MSGPFAWIPDPATAETSNVARFARKVGVEPSELRRWSVEDIGRFWAAVAEDLPIDFFTPYQQVLDLSRGPAWARWFVGGQLNVAHNCVDRHARSRPSDLALICEGEEGESVSMTYADLEAMTNRMANALKGLGVRRGDRVGMLLPMVPEIVAMFLAIAKIGAVALPIFSGFGASAIADRLNDSGAKVLVTADRFRRKGKDVLLKATADEAVALSPFIETVLVLRRDGGGASMGPRDRDLREAMRAASHDCPTEPMDAEDPFLIVYTSGTTGRPKGAVHVHGGFLVKIAQEVAHQADMRATDRLYWFTDMGWIMGPWEVIGGLTLGGTVFLYEGAPDYPDAGRLWSQVERHKITILGVSPTLVRSLMKHGDAPPARHDLSSLRLLGSTGEPWNPEPWRWYFEKIGGGRCQVVNFSGGTEVGACLLSPLPIDPIKPCALGGPSLGMDVDVFDATGHPIRGGVGELVCKQPWPGMTRGLWNAPERYLETYWSRWPGVWIHGDWASIDEDGQWFLHGRSDDTLNVAGKRIGPAEVESVLVGHPGVAESAVVGVPDEVKGEAIHAFVHLKPGIEGTPEMVEDLRERVCESLGKSFAPSAIRFVGDLPRTRSAKILRRAIRAAVLGEDPGDLSSLENPSALDAIRLAAREA